MANKTSPAVSSKATGSPVASTSASSIASSDGNFALPPPQHATLAPPANGAQAAAAGAAARPNLPAKKPTMSSRISGIFARREDSRDSSRVNLASEKIPEKVAEAKVANGDGPTSSPKPEPRRQASLNEKKPASLVDRSKSNAEKKKEQQAAANISKRFKHLEDGGHEHQLRVQRREEKLKDMFQNLMLGKKKEANPEEQPLSLMSGWVDQLRNDKEKFNIDHKTGASSSMTLVQKYGKCQEIIGRGAFGIVKIAHKQDQRDPKREQLFAVKEFKQRPGESDKKYNKRLTSEFCISSSMHHPNIINTLDLIQDEKGEFCEVMEYCAGGDLYTLILAAGQLEVVEADCFFKQLMRGVDYLHGMGVAHRDLKPENLLLTSHGAIKITDFGNGECFRMAWEEEAHMTAGICGSAPYIAPEEYVDEEFDPRAVDVWACGVIYMAMRTGRHLWRVAKKGEDEFYTKYLEDRKEESGYRPIEVLRRVRSPLPPESIRNG
ncbi:serine/threonine-protein kinase HAL4/sat4 [Diplodia seriata]|uniref:non-specific serine/threonine protein kinase n=1 Tax=Diplodia seriata TaxID=420778 RepID=A0A0G2GAA6_9PEZI|nr:putative serine threonine-protein kinase hal4 [Diplodia seriata]